jgi:hypothetical protein
VIKTPGTNCAFHAAALRQIGGFDPTYRFYLDETDVNLRIASLGKTAVVPSAQVVHGFLPSDRRRADRVPKDLFEIGASSAAFLKRHAPAALEQGWSLLELEQRNRLLRHMVDGKLEPRDVGRLIGGLRAGWAEGLARIAPDLRPLNHQPQPFLRLQMQTSGQGRVFAGWSWARASLLQKAQEARADGHVVSVFLLSLGVRRHILSFSKDGFWIQRGGLWGLADRSGALPLGMNFAKRVAVLGEMAAKFRPVK